MVQGYCDLLADLSLVIKIGRNVRKCTVYLYNIPEDVEVPEFNSIAWSFDAHGPVKGTIRTVIMRRENISNRLLCYHVPQATRENAPEHVKQILSPRKYLGVPTNAQLDAKRAGKKFLVNLFRELPWSPLRLIVFKKP